MGDSSVLTESFDDRKRPAPERRAIDEKAFLCGGWRGAGGLFAKQGG
ncbi:hypothetical protein HMPREF0262_01830 [Clostridium sp. ATCC 29733]|nr:hypothetical protein HMPREF0262_01830 [Clostridium sp. ATCC 29733]